MDIPDGFVPLENAGAFLELIGPIYLREGTDPPSLGIRAEERHGNRRGTVMGGMLATLVDVSVGLAIHVDAGDDRVRATVSLSVDYLKPAAPGDWIESRTSVDRVGATLAFAACSLRVGNREIVRARSVFAVAG